jgi:hypothetical protein
MITLNVGAIQTWVVEVDSMLELLKQVIQALPFYITWISEELEYQ